MAVGNVSPQTAKVHQFARLQLKCRDTCGACGVVKLTKPKPPPHSPSSLPKFACETVYDLYNDTLFNVAHVLCEKQSTCDHQHGA